MKAPLIISVMPSNLYVNLAHIRIESIVHGKPAGCICFHTSRKNGVVQYACPGSVNFFQEMAVPSNIRSGFILVPPKVPMVNSAGTTLSAESFLPTEVGVLWKGSDPGTSTQGEMRMEARFAAGPLLLPDFTNGKKFSTKIVD